MGAQPGSGRPKTQANALSHEEGVLSLERALALEAPGQKPVEGHPGGVLVCRVGDSLVCPLIDALDQVGARARDGRRQAWQGHRVERRPAEEAQEHDSLHALETGQLGSVGFTQRVGRKFLLQKVSAEGLMSRHLRPCP